MAAVCYRLRRGQIEFLLVQTRGSGRWTFPKGSTEPGLTHAQAAAMEAFEEAGVHGRIEEIAFAQYSCRRPGDPRGATRSDAKRFAVSAHLCEVLRLCAPKEANRNRTWFSAEETEMRLRDGRKNADGNQFARVVHQAVARIEKLRGTAGEAIDMPTARTFCKDPLKEEPLQKVQFEARPRFDSLTGHASFTPYKYRRAVEEPPVSIRDRYLGEVMHGEVLPFETTSPFRQSQKLLTGSRKLKSLGSGGKNN